MTGTTDGAARRRWRWLVGAGAGVVVAGYVGTAWALADQVPSGTSVAGVDIGGQSRDGAVRALQDELVPRLDDPIPVTVHDVAAEIDPAAAGLTVDVPATVDEVVGFTLDPRELLQHLAGDEAADVVTTADQDTLAAALTSLAETVDRQPVEGAITFDTGAPVVTEPAAGVALDVGTADDVLLDHWPSTGPPVELPADVTEPEIGAEAVEEAVTSFAVPATAGPLTVVVGEVVTELPVATVAPTLSMEPQDGDLAPVVDGEALKAALMAANPQLATEARNADIALQDGRPVVVPAVTGVTIDPAALAQAAKAGLTAADRTATLDSVVEEPELSTAEAQALGVTEVVSEFSSTLTDDADRTENLRIAARTVNGTLLLPGETFSLNETLGERTRAKGYNAAGAIENGRFVSDVGGGVSQMATTLFNGMFFAGLEDVEHKPHSLYISRYPEGREATVNWNDVDLKFRNDSEYGVLIETWVSGGQVHTRFWSTKVWDVTAITGDRHNFREPETIIDPAEDCEPQSPATGFDVDVTRVFSRGGAVEKRETFRTAYNAQNAVVCRPPARTTPTPTPSPSPTASPTTTATTTG